MGSDRKPSLINYWKIPRAAGKTPSAFYNYISLKRFQIIHKLFTVFSISVNEPCHNLPRRVSISKQKPTARGTHFTADINDRESLPPGH
jgi:hypothetical protein